MFLGLTKLWRKRVQILSKAAELKRPDKKRVFLEKESKLTIFKQGEAQTKLIRDGYVSFW